MASSKDYLLYILELLREIDGITEDEIINVIQPKNSNNNLIQTFSKNYSILIPLIKNI